MARLRGHCTARYRAENIQARFLQVAQAFEVFAAYGMARLDFDSRNVPPCDFQHNSTVAVFVTEMMKN